MSFASCALLNRLLSLANCTPLRIGIKPKFKAYQ